MLHVHLKDVDPVRAARVRSGEVPFRESVHRRPVRPAGRGGGGHRRGHQRPRGRRLSGLVRARAGRLADRGAARWRGPDGGRRRQRRLPPRAWSADAREPARAEHADGDVRASGRRPARRMPDMEPGGRPPLLGRHRRTERPPLRSRERPRRDATAPGRPARSPSRRDRAGCSSPSRAASRSSTGPLASGGTGSSWSRGHREPPQRWALRPGRPVLDRVDVRAGVGRAHERHPSPGRARRDGDTIRTGIGVSNGIAFAPDGRTMYFAEPRWTLVWAFDYDTDTGDGHAMSGSSSTSRPCPAGPDGATVDEAGCYWIACVFGSAVLRVTPGGRVDRRVPCRWQTDEARIRRGRPSDAVHHDDRGRRIARGRSEGARGGRPVRHQERHPRMPDPVFAGGEEVWAP